MSEGAADFPRLVLKQGRVFVRYRDVTGAPGEEAPWTEGPARVTWARPISGRGREIAVFDETGRKSFLAPGPEALDPESRAIALAELDYRYFRPRILKVRRLLALFGLRYWDVDTDKGRRRFVMKDPRHSVTRVTEDNWILRDVSGTRYEIASASSLDAPSRRRLEHAA
jgi:hypothetical protein